MDNEQDDRRSAARVDSPGGGPAGPAAAVADDLAAPRGELATLRAEWAALTESRCALMARNEALCDTYVAVDAEAGRYRDLFAHAPVAFAVTDLCGVIREANHAAIDLLNKRPVFLIGKPLIIFVANDDRQRLRSGMNLVRLGLVPSYEWRIHLRPARLEPVYASVVVARADDQAEGGALHWTISLLADPSGRADAGEETSWARAAQRRNRMRSASRRPQIRGSRDPAASPVDVNGSSSAGGRDTGS